MNDAFSHLHVNVREHYDDRLESSGHVLYSHLRVHTYDALFKIKKFS